MAHPLNLFQDSAYWLPSGLKSCGVEYCRSCLHRILCTGCVQNIWCVANVFRTCLSDTYMTIYVIYLPGGLYWENCARGLEYRMAWDREAEGRTQDRGRGMTKVNFALQFPLVVLHQVHSLPQEKQPDSQIGLSWLCSATFGQLLAFGAILFSSSNLVHVLPFLATFEQNIGLEHISSTKKSTISQETSIYANFLNAERVFVFWQMYLAHSKSPPSKTDLQDYLEASVMLRSNLNAKKV